MRTYASFAYKGGQHGSLVNYWHHSLDPVVVGIFRLQSGFSHSCGTCYWSHSRNYLADSENTLGSKNLEPRVQAWESSLLLRKKHESHSHGRI